MFTSLNHVSYCMYFKSVLCRLLEIRTETCQLYVVHFILSLSGRQQKTFFKKGKVKAACLPLSESTQIYLKLELSCTDAKVVPLLLPVYLKAGVFDANAEFPSGCSPSWEECKVDKQTKGQQQVFTVYCLYCCSVFVLGFVSAHQKILVRGQILDGVKLESVMVRVGNQWCPSKRQFYHVLVMTRQPILPMLGIQFFVCVCEIVSILFSCHRC